jgi:hypothetical protein
MTQPGSYWGTDVPISMPEPTTDDVIIDMGAHGFSINGLVHNLSQSDLEDYMMPTFTPEGSENG